MATFRGKAAHYEGVEQPPFQITADVLNNDVAFAAAAMEYLRTLVKDITTEFYVVRYVENLLLNMRKY